MAEKWATPASKEIVQTTMASLKANGINSTYVQNGQEAKKKILEMIPENSEVFTSSSTTLDQIEIPQAINETGKYNSVRKKLNSLDRTKDAFEMKKTGAAPEWVLGSVHAITEDGKVFIASNSGSQLPAYSYAAANVIWVVGTHKIVKDANEATERIYKYTLPLESERAKKAYGVAGSAVNKMLIINKEAALGRITIIFVDEKLGF